MLVDNFISKQILHVYANKNYVIDKICQIKTQYLFHFCSGKYNAQLNCFKFCN